jgi:hypothetical protein
VTQEISLDALYSKYEVEEDEDTKARQWDEILRVEKKMAASRRMPGTECGQSYHTGNGPFDVGIKGVDFFRLPHKVYRLSSGTFILSHHQVIVRNVATHCIYHHKVTS